jgi:hypothetical protein
MSKWSKKFEFTRLIGHVSFWVTTGRRGGLVGKVKQTQTIEHTNVLSVFQHIFCELYKANNTKKLPASRLTFSLNLFYSLAMDLPTNC